MAGGRQPDPDRLDERRLADARRAGDPDPNRVARIGKQHIQQLQRLVLMIRPARLDQGNGASHGASVTASNAFGEHFRIRILTHCKRHFRHYDHASFPYGDFQPVPVGSGDFGEIRSPDLRIMSTRAAATCRLLTVGPVDRRCPKADEASAGIAQRHRADQRPLEVRQAFDIPPREGSLSAVVIMFSPPCWGWRNKGRRP